MNDLDSKIIDVHLSGCTVIDDHKLLLLKKFKNSYYELPGGKNNPGEDIVTAAVREVKEEIGCDVKIIGSFGFYDFVHKGKNVRSNMFIAELIGPPHIAETEIFESMIWMPLDKYMDYDLAPNVLYFCKNYLNLKN